MHLNLRIVSGAIYRVEVQDEATVMQLRDILRHSMNADSDEMKFIYNAIILDEAKKLSAYEIHDNDYITVHINSKKPPIPKSIPNPITQDAERVEQQPSGPANMPLPSLSDSDDLPFDIDLDSESVENLEVIEQLQELGFLKSDCQQALNAARGNPHLAFQFLEADYIPSRHDAEILNNLVSQLQNKKKLLKDNPDALSEVIDEIEKQFPEQGYLLRSQIELLLRRLDLDPTRYKLKEIQKPVAQRMEAEANVLDEEERKQLAERETDEPHEPEGLSFSDFLSRYTTEDQQAIRRLVDLGFDIQLVIQVYEACDKNEGVAANCLLGMT